MQSENEALSKMFNERVDAADRELQQNNESLRADIARHVSHQILHLSIGQPVVNTLPDVCILNVCLDTWTPFM